MLADREVSLHCVERMPSNPTPDAHALEAAFYFARGVLLEHNIKQPAVTLEAF